MTPRDPKSPIYRSIIRASDDTATVAVYVRKGLDDNERTISFRRPPNIPIMELIDAGFAIDGNQATASVQVFTDDSLFPLTPFGDLAEEALGPGQATYASLPAVLRVVQKRLIDFLAEYELDVEFA